MLFILMIIFIFIMIAWGVISRADQETAHKQLGRGKNDASTVQYGDSGDSDGGCDGGGGGGD